MLERDVPFRFVHDEQELNALPIEDDEVEDVVGSPATDLLAWVEDEAILSLPLVPRHEDCAVPLRRRARNRPIRAARTPSPRSRSSNEATAAG